MQFFLLFVFTVLSGCVTSVFAQKRGRDPFVWFMIGMAFGLLGLMMLFVLPSLTKKGETTPDDHEEPLYQKAFPLGHEDLTQKFYLVEWYYLNDERQTTGPIGFTELKKLWENKTVREMTYVWHEEMVDWQRIAEIPGLEEALIGNEYATSPSDEY